MNLMVLVLAASEVDPPSGGLSPLAWVIILGLVSFGGVGFGVALKWITKLYDDLKACNAAKHNEAEEILAMLRVARSQMERHRDRDRDRGGKPV